MKGILQRVVQWLGGLNRCLSTRLALAAVVLFLVFDFTALALNIWLTYRIESQTVYINLAGRQRMLSQQMVKTLLEIESPQQTEQDSAELKQRLEHTFSLFDRTLLAFDGGGLTRDGLGKEIYLEPLDREEPKALVEDAQRIWLPYRGAMVELLYEPGEEALKNAVALAQDRNDDLLELMNRLTFELQQNTSHEASQIRLFQGIAFLLALLNFCVAITIYLVRMQRAHQERDLIDSVIDRVASGILVVDRGQQIIRANEAMELLCGYSESELLSRPVQQVLRRSGKEMIAVNRDGKSYYCSVDVSLAQLAGKPVEVYTINDVTEQKRTHDRLSILAYHDQLTGLPNRLLFDDRLKLELNHCRRLDSRLAVLFIDLDQFKPINDKYGHDVGDQLLRQFAARLNNSLRSTDTVSRRGGDEFTLILTDIPVRSVCEKLVFNLHQEITKPYFIEGREMQVGASIGVVSFPEDGDSAETLLKHADEAMYWAKHHIPGSIAFWSDLES
ncbi:diguanylate cyclase domain-containing protein [Marinobacterium lutimaris]|uniref:PAS domain S-box-containing protein/diguanylate cyclase (GGDEF) domain-containing protein n=1 Tax=Marinobacterium lutimaris TaxID=568106 RepID=A0A1H5XIX7_9GAMM|nr:diguanylate cyclase [Marinobacterium lutimaris]SEG11337.1 PAS domain S-box-containing protein/diguanylate cyclase (GGDEF) domain-containing protein [Marinobacterium lutimaris]